MRHVMFRPALLVLVFSVEHEAGFAGFQLGPIKMTIVLMLRLNTEAKHVAVIRHGAPHIKNHQQWHH